MSTADVRGVRIEYEAHGRPGDEAMLLIMGLGTQLVAWPHDFLAMLVRAGLRVVTMDNRDAGLSAKTAGPPPREADLLRALGPARLARSDYLLADLAVDALGVLDAIGVESAHLVGVSMGAMIAQQVAIDEPGRVRSLTSVMSNTGDRRHGLVSPTLAPVVLRRLRARPARTVEEAVARGVEGFRVIAGQHFDPGEVALMVRAAAARDISSSGTWRQLMAIKASPDRTPGLRRLHLPTLVVHGLQDRLVRLSGGVATASAVRGSRLLVFPDMGHDLPGPRRQEIAAAIVHNAERAS